MLNIREKISSDLGPVPVTLAIGGGLVSLLPFFGGVFWLADLFSHFRVQYCVGLVILALLFFVLRRYKAGGICMAFSVLNLIIIAPLYFGEAQAAPEQALPMRTMLINVNTQRGDIEKVAAEIERVNPDILVLEEVSARWLAGLAKATRRYPHSRAEPRVDNFGIALFSKFPIKESEIVYIGERRVPTIVATVDAGLSVLKIVATHPVPPGGAQMTRARNEVFVKLPEYTAGVDPVLLLGDLNTSPWSIHFKRLVSDSGLKDSTRGFGVQPTWPADNILLRIPIDHCLHSRDILISDRRIGREVGSDHFPLILDFVISGNAIK